MGEHGMLIGMACTRSPIPRLEDDYTRAAAAKRLDFVRETTGARPAHLGRYSLNPAAVAGNVENFIGVAQVPIGIAGPLLVNGEHARGEFRARARRILRTAGDDRRDAGRQLQPGHEAATCRGRRQDHRDG